MAVRNAVLTLEHLRLELHVQLRALREARVRDVADRLEQRRRAVYVRAARCTDTVRQRGRSIAPGRQRTDPLPDRGVARYRQHTAGHLAELGVVFLELVDHMRKDLAHAEVCALVVVAVLRCCKAHRLNILIADKICIQRLDQLVHRALLLVVYQVLDRGY